MAGQAIRDHVGLGDESGAEQLGQRLGVDLVGLDLRVADGLEVLGVGERERDALIAQEVGEPVPPGRRLDDGAVRALMLAEVGPQGVGVVLELLLAREVAGLIDRDDEAGALVQVDAGVVG